MGTQHDTVYYWKGGRAEGRWFEVTGFGKTIEATFESLTRARVTSLTAA